MSHDTLLKIAYNFCCVGLFLIGSGRTSMHLSDIKKNLFFQDIHHSGNSVLLNFCINISTVNQMLVASSVCDVGPSVMWVPL